MDETRAAHNGTSAVPEELLSSRRHFASMNTIHSIKFHHTLGCLLKPPYSTSLSTCTGTKRRYSGPVLEVFYSLIYTNETSGLSLSESGGGGIQQLPCATGDEDHLADMDWAVHNSSISQLVLMTPSRSGSGLCAQMYFHLVPSPPFVYSASTSPKTFLLLPTKMMAQSPLFNPVLDICLPALLLQVLAQEHS